MLNKALFTSNSAEWETPQTLFDELNAEFGFMTDVAATWQNKKCAHFYSKEDDSLKQAWRGVCWCNPPYGREIGKWVEKAYQEAQSGNAATVMLIPARTDTRYFHEYIYGQPNVEIRFLRGRLKFSNSKNSAPFPSMIVIFRRQVFNLNQYESVFDAVTDAKREGLC